jgi:hypothetical protein
MLAEGLALPSPWRSKPAKSFTGPAARRRAGLSCWTPCFLPKLLPRCLPQPTRALPAQGRRIPALGLVLPRRRSRQPSCPVGPTKPEVGADQAVDAVLVGRMAFACRSFNNLNQILEFTAFVASQLTGAEGERWCCLTPTALFNWINRTVSISSAASRIAPRWSRLPGPILHQSLFSTRGIPGGEDPSS